MPEWPGDVPLFCMPLGKAARRYWLSHCTPQIAAACSVNPGVGVCQPLPTCEPGTIAQSKAKGQLAIVGQGRDGTHVAGCSENGPGLDFALVRPGGEQLFLSRCGRRDMIPLHGRERIVTRFRLAGRTARPIRCVRAFASDRATIFTVPWSRCACGALAVARHAEHNEE